MSLRMENTMKYHLLKLFRRGDMEIICPDDFYAYLRKAEMDGAIKITIDFKENHKGGKYPTGPIYTIPSMDSVSPMTLYAWLYSAYTSGCAYFRLDFGRIPPDGEEYVYIRDIK